MEIRFSTATEPFHSLTPGGLVDWCAQKERVNMELTKERGLNVRFTLPGSSTEAHDRVIRALLTLDPDATVRTARAVYEGLEDFERQRGK